MKLRDYQQDGLPEGSYREPTVLAGADTRAAADKGRI